MGLIKGLRDHFDEKGLIRGTQEIVDLAIAITMVGTAAYVVGRQIYVHHVIRANPNNQGNVNPSPIDSFKTGSALEMQREAKSEKKQLKKMIKEIEETAVENLTAERNKFFKNLPYEERKNLLEIEGLLEPEERRIARMQSNIKKSVDAEVQKNKENSQTILKKTVHNIPGYTNSDMYYLKKGKALQERALYDALKKETPTAASPNRFIIRPNGSIEPDTYEDKKARIEEIPDNDHDLEPKPSYFNQLQYLSKDIQDAYMDMRGQLARISNARKDEFEQQLERKKRLTPRQRADAVTAAWETNVKDAMENPQEPWYGNRNLDHKELEYRTTASTSQVDVDKFFAEMDRFREGLLENGIDMDSILGNDEESIKNLDNLIEKIQVAKTDLETEAIEDKIDDGLETIFGVHPKDIPYFDNDFYEADYVPHKVEVGTTTKRMNHLRFGNTYYPNLRENSYEPMHKIEYARRKSNHILRADINRARMNEFVDSITESMGGNLMNRELFGVPVDRPSKGILDKDLVKYKKKDKDKKKKKKDKGSDFFDMIGGIELDTKSEKKKAKKKDEKKSKKEKGKKKKNKSGKVDSSFFEGSSSRKMSDDIVSNIFSGVGKGLLESYKKDFKKMRKGNFYST